MRQLQDLGHTVIFLIGDFTSMIGDPSGRNATRPPLTREQIEANAQDLLRAGEPGARPANDRDPLQLRMVRPARRARHDPARGAATRWRACWSATTSPSASRPARRSRVHEFLYPLMQGYDSVALKADLELGGTDQKFNLLVGPRAAEGVRPGAAVHPDHAAARRPRRRREDVEVARTTTSASPSRPTTMFAKLMIISDMLMWRYYELLSFRTLEPRSRSSSGSRSRAQSARRQGDAGARKSSRASIRAGGAEAALADFNNRAKGGVPDDIPDVDAGRRAAGHRRSC